MTWNHFLLSALAVMVLAVCHSPQQFSESCKDEFFMTLELVRGLSADSYVSKKLWRTIHNLRKLVPRFHQGSRAGDIGEGGNNVTYEQFQPNQQQQNDAQRSAAMVMAGLATGQPLDESAFFAENAQTSTDLNSNITRNNQAGQPVTSPNGMANELTYLFEAAGALNSNGQSGWANAFGGDMNSTSNAQMHNQQSSSWPQDNEEAGRIFRELY